MCSGWVTLLQQLVNSKETCILHIKTHGKVFCIKQSFSKTLAHKVENSLTANVHQPNNKQKVYGPKFLNNITMVTAIATHIIYIISIISHKVKSPLTVSDHQPTKLPTNSSYYIDGYCSSIKSSWFKGLHFYLIT